MFKFYVLWPNGRGYTKDLPNMGAVFTELSLVDSVGEDPTVITVTFLDPDVVELVDNRIDSTPRPVSQAPSGKKVRD